MQPKPIPLAETATVSERYIDLLKKSLLDELYIESEMKLVYLVSSLISGTNIELADMLKPHSMPRGIPEIVRQAKQDGMTPGIRREKEDGSVENLAFMRNYIECAHTMIGRQRMDHLQYATETILAENIPGDFIETGVWRGGAVIFMRGILAAHGITDRTVWAADSFDGLPESTHPTDKVDLTKKNYPVLAVSLEEVQELFDRYGLLDDQVQFLQGWFKDTLPEAPIEQLALLRLDGDLYDSTIDAITPLYEKVAPGGFIIVDDYNETGLGCKQAIDDFRAEQGITEPIQPIDKIAVFWRKV